MVIALVRIAILDVPQTICRLRAGDGRPPRSHRRTSSSSKNCMATCLRRQRPARPLRDFRCSSSSPCWPLAPSHPSTVKQGWRSSSTASGCRAAAQIRHCHPSWRMQRNAPRFCPAGSRPSRPSATAAERSVRELRAQLLLNVRGPPPTITTTTATIT